VQMTLLSAGKMGVLQDYLSNAGSLVVAPFPRRPESMFDGVEMPVAIAISIPKSAQKNFNYATSRVGRIFGVERPHVLAATNYLSHDNRIHDCRVAKFGTVLEIDIFQKLIKHKEVLDAHITGKGKHRVYYQEACRYWLKATHKPPFFRRNGEKILPPHGRVIGFDQKTFSSFAMCLLNSSLFYWFYTCFSDCEHVNDELVRTWRCSSSIEKSDWESIANRLFDDMEAQGCKKTIRTKQGHTIEYHEIRASGSKLIIDEIDTILATHYGFTPEELDFIINYDIKYRMGLGGGSAEEDDE